MGARYRDGGLRGTARAWMRCEFASGAHPTRKFLMEQPDSGSGQSYRFALFAARL